MGKNDDKNSKPSLKILITKKSKKDAFAILTWKCCGIFHIFILPAVFFKFANWFHLMLWQVSNWLFHQNRDTAQYMFGMEIPYKARHHLKYRMCPDSIPLDLPVNFWLLHASHFQMISPHKLIFHREVDCSVPLSGHKLDQTFRNLQVYIFFFDPSRHDIGVLIQF